MATGWRPKFSMPGPIPLNFDSNVVDAVVEELTSFGSKYRERVVYLGNQFNVHKANVIAILSSSISSINIHTGSSMMVW